VEIKKIFDILNALNILGINVRKYYLSKLALLVVRAINNYNFNIKEMDIYN
jgi:hypothetical protein